MRWYSLYRRSGLTGHRDPWRVLQIFSSVGAMVRDIRRPLCQPVISRYNRFIASNGEGGYLPWLVNIFTSRCQPHPAGNRRYGWGMMTPHPRIPNRTRRRVHVMPWATPIRRIGRALSYYNGREGDDPAD